jgi:uncharacterized membrane protein
VIKVLYAGDSEIQVVTVQKGMDNYSYSVWTDDSGWLRRAFESAGDIACTHLSSFEVLGVFPNDLADLSQYDVIIISDVGINSLALLPSFRPPFAIPMGSNRLDNLRTYVENGGGLMMCGGWMSFSGFAGRAGYGGSAVEDILPVVCERGADDRIEVVQGYRLDVTDAGRSHPVTQGLHWDADYALLGYNRVHAKGGAAVLAQYNGDPQIAVGTFGKGRSLAFASDVSPHWAGSFLHWVDYNEFWTRSVRWLAGEL